MSLIFSTANFKILLLTLFLFSLYVTSLAQRKDAFVDIGSIISLKLYLLKDKDTLGIGTGFIVRKEGTPFLITNLHNLTGIDYWTGKFFDSLKRKPNNIIIEHHLQNKLGNWISKKQMLYTGSIKNWNEVVIDGKIMDVVSLKLTDTSNVSIYDIRIDHGDTPFRIIPGSHLFVIGYPFGMTASKQYPVWKTVFLASEYADNYLDIPAFLIDGTTRKGMSGSPVIMKGDYTVIERETSKQIPISVEGYSLKGIYSGHIDALELSAVFKTEVIETLLNSSK